MGNKLYRFLKVKLPTFAFIVLQLSSNSPIAAAPVHFSYCLKFYSGPNISLSYDKTAFTGNQLDISKLRLWAESQPPHAIDEARFVAKNIKLVSISIFEKQLHSNFSTYLQSIGPLSKVVIVSESGKSNGWIAEYIMKNFPEMGMRQVEFDKLNDFIMSETQSGHDPSQIHWAIVDDATYSGLQLRSHIGHIEYLANKNSFAPVIDVVVPYYTHQAKKYLEEETSYGNQARVYSLNRMHSVQELFEKKRLFSGVLTIFQHKIPDSQSFDHNIRRGWIFATEDARGNIVIPPNKIKFIIENPSPYSQK